MRDLSALNPYQGRTGVLAERDDGNGYSLAEISIRRDDAGKRPARLCSWPFGEPKTPAYRTCGAPAAIGRSYCPEYHARAYRRVPLVRDRRKQGTANPALAIAQDYDAPNGSR